MKRAILFAICLIIFSVPDAIFAQTPPPPGPDPDTLPPVSIEQSILFLVTAGLIFAFFKIKFFTKQIDNSSLNI